MDRPTLSLSAQSRINELRTMGIEPTIEEVIWLHETGKRVENPPGLGPLDAIEMPVIVGNVTLRRMGIGALLWWMSSGAVWFPPKHPLSDYVMAFVCAHTQDKDAIHSLQGYDTAQRIVRAWMADITCSKIELDAALTKVLRPAQEMPHSEDDGKDPDWVAIVADLRAAYGGTFEEWVWERSTEMCMLFMRRARTRDGQQTSSKYDPLTLAIWHQQQAMNTIVESRKQKEPTNG